MTTFISKVRKLKVSAVMVRGRWTKSIKPKLTLSGDWMKEAGFTVGSQIQIEVLNGTLILKKVKNELHS